MPEPNRSIFRPEALRFHIQRNEEPVYPRLISPRAFVILWILLGVVLSIGVLAVFAEVPVHASATGFMIEGTAEPVLALLLPPRELRHLQPGQRAFIKRYDGNLAVARIFAVEGSLMGPAAVRSLLDLSETAASGIKEPVAVAFARLDAGALAGPAGLYQGSSFVAEIELGTRRAITLFPGATRFFRDNGR